MNAPSGPCGTISGTPARRYIIPVAVLIVLFAGCHSTSVVRKPERSPNILFIPVDDLNDWIHPLGGHPGVQTPNLDRLAARGMVFTRAYCSAPACNPSRTSVLTGVAPFTSGVYHNEQPWRPALPDAVTLPGHFKANGYHAIGRGKVFHGTLNDAKAWHEYVESGQNPAPLRRPLNGIVAPDPYFDWGPLDVDDADMDDMKVVNWAAQQLHRKYDRPLFLAAGLVKPHLPWYVPRKYFDLYPISDVVLPLVKPDDLEDIPPMGRQIAKPELYYTKVMESNNWEKGVQGYLASISFTDACVGRLLDALDASGQADNTIIVFWGDNGWHSGEKLHWRKFTLWEESTRVPLIIVAPGVTEPNSVCDRTVSLLDIYPTLAELCGTSLPAGIEGHSLVPLLKNLCLAWPYPAVTTHGRNNHAIRSERWRYIRYCDGTEELYDHDHDPREWINLANRVEYASNKKELSAFLPTNNAPNAPFDMGILKGRHIGCDSAN